MWRVANGLYKADLESIQTTIVYFTNPKQDQYEIEGKVFVFVKLSSFFVHYIKLAYILIASKKITQEWLLQPDPKNMQVTLGPIKN